MKMTFATLLTLLILVAALPGVHGQAPPPATFEVASIRLNTSGAAGGGGGPRPGGRYMMTNVPTRTLISIGYGIPSDRVLDGPGWILTDRYDIEARTKENPTREETSQMLQSLLRERFNLAIRPEKRDLPIYTLQLARRDGQLGPGMRRTTIDCNDPEVRKKAAATAAPGRIACGLTSEQGDFQGGGITMPNLEIVLSSAAGRPVFNQTGLTGSFDVELKWTPTLGADAAPADAVSIFTAVQEQLGLRLENATAPLDVVVIDRIERPTEN
jgi:uncharacterized protein (TIGR03435 family)